MVARVYRAMLHGDRVEWIDLPPERDPTKPIPITVVEEATQAPGSSGSGMAAALEALAAAGGLPGIPDPVDWQREIRQDRPLPHRG